MNLSKKKTAFVLKRTVFGLNMTGFVPITACFVIKITGFVRNITGNVPNMIELVQKMTVDLFCI